jgi:hypothetical protein
MKKEVQIEGKTYLIDIDKARTLGLIEEKFPDQLMIGDVFTNGSGHFLVTCKTVNNSYFFVGWEGLGVWDNGKVYLNKEAAFEPLKRNKYIYSGNINEKFINLLKQTNETKLPKF